MKTKERDPGKVTHFFEVAIERSADVSLAILALMSAKNSPSGCRRYENRGKSTDRIVCATQENQCAQIFSGSDSKG